MASKKIDRDVNQLSMISKALKKLDKDLNETSKNFKDEELTIRKMKFLKASVPFIEKRDQLEEQISVLNKEKRKIG